MNQFCSMFSQRLQILPRDEFHQAVKRTHAERHARGFPPEADWGQFVAMLFRHLGRAHSLREIIGGLQSCEGELRHLGITAPRRSTLAYATEHRPWSLYQELFLTLLHRLRDQGMGKKRFRFKNKLVSLDSTIIDLSICLFNWAHFRRTKCAIKLHLLLDHDGYLPTFAWITKGKVADIRIARQKCLYPFRRIEVYDPETKDVHTFLTNHMDWGPKTIAAIYKDRWQIEIFFEYLKRNLKIETFVGTSANAVKIQIWTALIAMLLLRYLQLVAQFAWSLSHLVALLRMSLFTHRDLWTWLHKPFETPPAYYEPEQLALNLRLI